VIENIVIENIVIESIVIDTPFHPAAPHYGNFVTSKPSTINPQPSTLT